MGGKKAAGENSKKAAGNARKADAASQKKAAEDQKKAAEEDKQWSKGSKSNAKKEDAEAKKAEAARKKAERDAQMAEEEAAAPSKPKGAGAKTAQKKSRGLDLSQLDDAPSKKGSSLNASGIDNALDALSLTNKDTTKVERHPERRFKAAYAAFEARRLPEIEEENPGLRRQQRMDLCRKEFEKSEENPFNQVHVAVNASKEEIAAIREQERSKTERRLG
ncbi:Coiled-coil domain-containing protein [Penicillium longicatenatum]|uniref:Coiled-coil domain-containing protein n=1 Tax=Penicillium longicatenatum TaxID=1561947 RepID=UPI002547482B|nr:Coiled-coil domain-containing protein [Penicillium longicatenatum]KAJ5649025.1 Coiled-coil domain-containing protein [Penicillium longicatenatum]